jgi:hypothetical protein
MLEGFTRSLGHSHDHMHSHDHWDIPMITFVLMITCAPMITGAYPQSHDLDHRLITHGVVTHHDSFDPFDHDSLRLGVTHLD